MEQRSVRFAVKTTLLIINLMVPQMSLSVWIVYEMSVPPFEIQIRRHWYDYD